MDQLLVEDPLLGHRLRPNLQEVKVVVPDRPYPQPIDPEDERALQRITRRRNYYCSTNSRGYRTAEFADHPAEGVTRIITMGDEVTFGHGVGDDLCFPAVLGRTLPPDRHEVINLAVPGYGSQQLLDQLQREVVDYGPQVVAICLGMAETLQQPEHSDPRRVQVNLEPRRLAYTLDLFRNNLIQIIDHLQGFGIRVILLTPPAGSFFPFPDIKQYAAVVRELARAGKVSLIDLEAMFRAAEREHGLMLELDGDVQRVVAYLDSQPRLLFSIPYPPNPKQHIADEIYRFLDEKPIQQRLLITGGLPNADGHRLIAEHLRQTISAHVPLPPPLPAPVAP